MKMDITTLTEEFKLLETILQKYCLTDEAIISMYWNLFLNYVGDSTFVSHTIIDEFQKRCPKFYSKLSEHAVTKKRVITLENMYKKAPHQEFVAKCENGHFSHILYVHMYDSSSIASYKPFGKMCPPKEPEYFIKLISSSTNNVLDSNARYELFKNYFYSHIVHEVKTEWSRHYAFEHGLWQNIKASFPELAKRFEKEQDEYLHSIGYYAAIETLRNLNKEYDVQITNMQQEEKDRLAEIWPYGENDAFRPCQDRRIEILY